MQGRRSGIGLRAIKVEMAVYACFATMASLSLGGEHHTMYETVYQKHRTKNMMHHSSCSNACSALSHIPA